MEKRISALDGWRGIAIALVLVDHLQLVTVGHYWHGINLGQRGVAAFFVLSGFLITSKLIEGKIDLKHFYIRRFFRLMPAAWAYIAVVAILAAITGAHADSGSEVASCLLFYRNYFHHPGNALSHFWTLSIEEQFYLIWPSVLLLCGVRNARQIALSGIIVSVFLRMKEAAGPYTAFHTELHADALLAGCFLALLLEQESARQWIRKHRGVIASVALIAIPFLVLRRPDWPLAPESIAVAVLIVISAECSDFWLARALSWSPLVWLGAISYSVYLWQQIFFFWPNRPLPIIVLIPFVGAASYYLIERPTTALGKKMAPSVRPNVDLVSACD